jgi:hypothetical protein
VRTDLLAADKAERRRRRLLGAGAVVLGAAAIWSVPLERLLPPAPAPADAAAVVAAALPAAPPPEAAAPSLKTRPLSAWLAEIARDAERDLVLSPELRGDLTASEASALGWHERLDAYARVFGFDYDVGDGLIEVRRSDDGAAAARGSKRERGGGGSALEPDLPAAPSVAVSVSREPAERGDANAAASSKDAAAALVAAAPPARTRVVHLVHASAKETAAVLAQAGKAMDVVVAADGTSNTIVLSGGSDPIARLLNVVAELDRPRRRILLEAKIVEISRSARLDLGVEWKVTGTVGGDVRFPPNLTDAGNAALLVATGGATALDARISALEAGGKLRVVSRPSVVMLEGSPATIESARILRIRLPSHGAVVGEEVVQTPSSNRATEEIPVGVRLEVTPAIRGGSRVLLRIKAKSSSLGAPLPPDDIPEELSRMVDAEVLVKNGETAVLGGLSREAGSKTGAGVPGLRRLPALGVLFGKKSDVSEEEELLVIVTPRLLD